MTRGAKPNLRRRHRASREAKAAAAALRRRILGGESHQMRRWKDFKLFAGANGLDEERDLVETMVLFVAAHRLDTIVATRWSTLGNYLRQIIAHTERASSISYQQRQAATKILSYVDRMHAASDTNHATDMTYEELLRLCIAMEDGVVRVGALMMLFTGLRAQDLSQLTRRQVLITDKSFRVEIRLAKKRGIRLHRTELTVPIAWLRSDCDKEAFKTGMRAIEETLAATSPTALIFPQEGSTSLASAINEAFKVVQKQKKKGKISAAGSVTSYSLRRNFVHRTIERFTDESGVIDWDKVTAMTLHFDEATVKAYYQRHASDDTQNMEEEVEAEES
jgi:integrase